MTAIAPTEPPRETREGKGQEPQGIPVAGSRTFLDTLLDIRGADARPFGNGTMRSSTEAFGARGLFFGATPAASSKTGRHSAGVAIESSGAAKSIMPPAPQASARQESVTCSAEPERSFAEVPLASRQAAGGVPSDAGQEHPARSGDAVSASATGSSLGQVPIPQLRGTEPETAEVLPPPMRRSPPVPGGTSTIKVHLHRDGPGAIVSVIGGPADTRQQTPLSKAVRRLLATHGLVLSELRVARRALGAGQERERE